MNNENNIIKVTADWIIDHSSFRVKCTIDGHMAFIMSTEKDACWMALAFDTLKIPYNENSPEEMYPNFHFMLEDVREKCPLFYAKAINIFSLCMNVPDNRSALAVQNDEPIKITIIS